jgi:hypothetical protein
LIICAEIAGVIFFHIRLGVDRTRETVADNIRNNVDETGETVADNIWSLAAIIGVIDFNIRRD